MKNCLSIDCDVLFNCETYSDYTLHDLPADLTWEIIELIKEKEDDNIDLEPDQNVLQKLQELIKLNPDTQIVCINEHDELVDILKGSKWNIYNADFHHDITYEGDDSELNIENWVRHAKRQGLLEQYYWLHRTMSEHPQTRLMSYFIDNIEDVQPTLAPKFDLIVICISRHFTPRKYWNTITNIITGA